jgi:D-xylose transport system ATP-binding protein
MADPVDDAGAATPLIEMRHIHKYFGGVRAVDDVSLTLAAGEVVGILGHNGAGKSTLMGILAGAVERDSGTILMNGVPLKISHPRDARDAGIEMIYQNLALADNLDAVMNFFLGREVAVAGMWRKDRDMEAVALEAIHRVNPNFSTVREPVRRLSGGQRQSIAIARALYFNAKVLVMDEPTAALGPAETAAFKALVGRVKATGVGILLISHDIHDVFELSDRLLVMSGGRVVGTRKTTEVTKDEVLRMVVMGLAGGLAGGAPTQSLGATPQG